jgi:hypothetical protein
MFLRQGLGQDDEWVKGEGRAAGQQDNSAKR